MPIFISYSQKDKTFVDKLARNLADRRHHIWMDRWELNVGDSLTQKIQEALTDSSAMLLILSNNSVGSEWCKREFSAALVRELEEKRVVVMPCVIDDCPIPLFIRDKLYADFRLGYDVAFNLIDRSLATISNSLQGRTESPRFHTDWAVDWYTMDHTEVIRWTFVDHGHDWPYVVLSTCTVLCDRVAGEKFKRARAASRENSAIRDILRFIVAQFDENPLSLTISDQFEMGVSRVVRCGSNGTFKIMITTRRMGADNGMDTLVHLDASLSQALEHMEAVVKKPG